MNRILGQQIKVGFLTKYIENNVMKTIRMIKYTILAIALLAAFSLPSIAANPEAKAQFIADVKVAFDTKDSTKLLDLVFWEGVSPEMKKMITQQMSGLVQQTVAQIELIALDPESKLEYTRDGITYRPNLTVVNQLKITFKSDNPANPSSAAMPVGEKGGKLFITTAAPVK
jgi:hypothetical protein